MRFSTFKVEAVALSLLSSPVLFCTYTLALAILRYLRPLVLSCLTSDTFYSATLRVVSVLFFGCYFFSTVDLFLLNDNLEVGSVLLASGAFGGF